MATPAWLAAATDGWSAWYADHRMVSVTVRFLHLGALLFGGGTALATDRLVLTSVRKGLATSLGALEASHRVVVPSLALVVLTGLLMTAADLETYRVSSLYWTKMGLVGLLLLNGTALLVLERRARSGRRTALAGLSWVSAVSLLLWLANLFAGVWLTVAA
jgi:hypothetical protein